MIKERLLELKDEKYKKFHSRLMPTVENDRVIGVRTPELRRFAKELRGSEEAKNFMQALPHEFYEENNLHGFFIEFIKNYDECVAELDRFLPFVDNWATCDMTNPKILNQYPERLIKDIRRWLSSDDVYTVRFGLKTLMNCFLDEHFKEEYLELAAKTPCDEYYLSMMTAWFFATALAKQYDAALAYLVEKRLDKSTHNRAIQKALESYRIASEQKKFLRTLKY